MPLFLLILISLLFSLKVYSQDTLTVMHYNLLYYGQITSFCNNSNNSLAMKDPHLRAVLNHVKPDIFTVNEIADSEAIHQHLLDENLNIAGINYYRKAAFSPVASSNIVNMLYYDSRKLRLKKQSIAQTYLRDIDVYELYYYANDLPLGDTAFIICAVGHLKAGDGSSNENLRKVMAENTMKYLEQNHNFDNVLFMGDFNLYSGNEPAFQQMINYPNANTRLIDPIGQIGDWNNNSLYAGIHTQSTNVSSNDCKAGGGMDDRFDFILISDEVRFGTKKVRYVQESYRAVGQDGLRFNSTINSSPANTDVPQSVANALYNMSDHLPITLKLKVDKVLDIQGFEMNPFQASVFPNPAGDDVLLKFYTDEPQSVLVNLFDAAGKSILEIPAETGKGQYSVGISLSNLKSGFYMLQVSNGKGKRELLKLVKVY